MRPVTKISQPALDFLYGYHWPGNVRELAGVIETSVIMAEGDTLLPSHLPPKIRNSEAKREGGLYFPPGTPLREVEKEMIRQTLLYTNGNKTRAAELLGIGTRTLYRKIEEYGL
jgi:two-component system response regulator HydG